MQQITVFGTVLPLTYKYSSAKICRLSYRVDLNLK